MSALAPSAVSQPLDLLIVDDSAEEIATIRRELRSRFGNRFAVRELCSAREALSECRRRQPDCLLLDVRMPEMDGLAFLKQLGGGKLPKFPIIMLTSYGDETSGAQAIQFGAQDYLVKGQTSPVALSRAIDHARERFRIAAELSDSRARLQEANEELRQSGERLNAIFAQTSVGIAQVDLSGRFTRANDAYLKVAGRSWEELSGMCLHDLSGVPVPGDDCGNAEGEIQYVHPDGSRIWVYENVSTVRDGREAPVARVVLVRDITARKRAEEAQSLLASIVEASADAVVYQDLDGIIRAWNHGAETTYGFCAREAIGRGADILIPVDKLEEWQKMRHDAACNRPLQGRETIRIRKDGYRVQVAITFSAVRDRSGSLIGYSSIDRNITEKKRADQALVKSEARYRLLANAMPQMVYTASASGENEFINAKWSEYTGCPEEDALSFNWVSRVHPEDRERCLARWAADVANGHLFECEIRIERADGEFCWHLSRAIPLRTAEGLVSAWIGTYTDIHDRKVAEARLKLSEERLRMAQRAAGIVVWDLDLRNGQYTEMPEFYAQFGFEPGATVTFPDWLERVHPDDRGPILEATRDLSKYPAGSELEFRILRPDGSVRWLLGKGSTIFDDTGRAIRVTGVNVDITGRKQAEAEVQENRERLRLVLNTAGLFMWEWEVTTDTIVNSDTTAHLFRNQGERPKLDINAFIEQIHPADRDYFRERFQAALESDAPFDLEFRMVDPDGRTEWIESHGAVVRDAAGDPVRMLGSARKITERKAFEQKIAAAAKLESIGVMAGGIAHDFNNLLVCVIGSASLAQGLLPATHGAYELMSDVMKAGERAAQLTSQILASAGKGDMVMEPVGLDQTVREALLAIQPKLLPETVVELDLEPGLTTSGDPAQIRQALLNLLDNAIESLEEGVGSISVRTRLRQIGLVEVGRTFRNAVTTPGEYIAIEISDTGCGIADSITDKVFEPFFSTKFTGRGLGLSAADGIVRIHKGAIYLGSRAGGGTAVTVLLPALSDAKAPHSPGDKSSKNPEDHTILVVDDEESVAHIAAAYLTRHGYRVLVANNGPAALDAVRTGQPISAVLLDLTMPEMCGQEVLRRLRQSRRDLPIILSSGFTQEEALSTVEGEEIDGFLPKPYTGKRLLETIGQVLKLPVK